MQFLQKRMIQTIENGEKPHFGPDLGPLGLFFFFKNLAPSVTGYHGQLSSCTISEKNNDPVLRKFSDGRTERRTRVISQDAARRTPSVQQSKINFLPFFLVCMKLKNPSIAASNKISYVLKEIRS